jgi:hypothetical protein
MLRYNRNYIENLKEKNILDLGTTAYFNTTLEDFERLKIIFDIKKIDYYFDEYDDIVKNNDDVKVYITINYFDYCNYYDLFKDYAITLDFEDQNFEMEYLVNECFNYKHYFIFSYNYTWRSVFAYKIAENTPEDLFYREHETSLYYKNSTKKGKIIKMMECSHDQPTGTTLFYIGLTDEEFEKVKNKQDINFILEQHKHIIKCL